MMSSIFLYPFICSNIPTNANHIGGVMVRVLASNAVDRGFDTQSGQTKDYKIGIRCFSANYKQAALRRKSKDWLVRNQDNLSERATSLSTDCCFSEQALQKSISACWFNTKRTSSFHLKQDMIII
jgi:hypothetical protein